MGIYAKIEQEDLTADQKKVLKGLAEYYERVTIQAARAFDKDMS